MENNNKYQIDKAITALSIAKEKEQKELRNSYFWHHLNDKFNTNAINTEVLGGLGTTFNFKKKTVTLTENGISSVFKTNEVTLENQTIFYILK